MEAFASAVEPDAEVQRLYEDVPFRVMHVESVLYDLTDPSPLVHLLEAETPFRYLVIPVALADAIAIQHAHSAIEGRRPSTHELMNAILTRLGTEVIAARIVRYDEGVFYAELDLMTPRVAKSLTVERATRSPWRCARTRRRRFSAPKKCCSITTRSARNRRAAIFEPD